MPSRKRRAQVLDQPIHARLRFRLEVPIDVDLAEQLAEGGVEVVDRALPARLHFFDPLERAAVEIEPRFDELGAQVRRQRRGGVELQVRLPAIDRYLVDRRCHRLEVARLGDDHRTGVRDAELLGPDVPVEAGELLRQIGKRHLVVGLDRIAALDVRPVRTRKAGFEREDVFGGAVRRRQAGEPEHPCDIRRGTSARYSFSFASSFR